MHQARVLALLAGGVLAAASCHAVLGLDDYEVREPGTGGSGGSGFPCDVPSDCPGTDTDCELRTCSAGVCGRAFTDEGAACTEDGGQRCDGAGECVECLGPDDCAELELCLSHLCVPGQCGNEELDDGETDVDCGGSDCPPCANGRDCLLWSDCASAFCQPAGAGGSGAAGGSGGGGGSGGATAGGAGGSGGAGGGGAQGGTAGTGGAAPTGGSCAPCAAQEDCSAAPDRWCDASVSGGACVARKETGEACAQAHECLSGACPPGDLVCCDLPCDGECVACLAAKSDGPTGTCAPVTAGEDPDAECAVGQTPCGPSGVGCNGAPETPACLSTCSSCMEIFGANPAVLEICADSATSCTLRADTTGGGCAAVCQASGETCDGAWADSPEGSCGVGAALTCALSQQASMLCDCSLGCGANAPCTAPQACIAGACQ